MTDQPHASSFLRFNPDDARKLFSRLDHIHLVAILPDAPKGTLPHGRYFGADVEAAVAWADRSNGNGWNTYWTLNYVAPTVGTKPGKKDIRAARGAHCDLDPPKDGPWDKGAAVAALTGHAVPPSMIIDSGNGVQPVWLLDAPEKEWQPVEHVNMTLRDSFGGDDCFNIDRLLRIPGSVNYPNKAKRDAGRVPCMAGWVQGDTGQRYTLGDLTTAFPATVKPKDSTAANDTGDRVPTQTGALIAAIKAGDNWHNNMLRLTARLVAKGRSTVEILAMAEGLTLPGYTVDQTLADMRGMIADARRKWDYAEPEDDPVEDNGSSDADWPALDLTACASAKAPPREWMTEGWVPCHKATLLAGDGGVGKSLLAQIQATCIAAGRPFMGVETRQANAAYVSWEDDADELWRRQESICAAMGIPMASLAGKLHLVSLTEEANPFLVVAGDEGLDVTKLGRKIERLVDRHSIGLLILDNASQTASIDHNKVEEVAPFAHWLGAIAQRQSGAVILLHHTNKAGQDYLGSVAYNNQFRSRMLLARPEDCPDPDLRELTNPKANYAQSGNSIEVRWYHGSFIRNDELPDEERFGVAELLKANGENTAFLACLRARAKDGEGREVGPAPGPNYAPSQFEGMPQAKGHKKAALKRAMERLFSIGSIESVTVERPGKSGTKTIIREALATSPNAPPNASRTHVPNAPEPRPERPRTHTVYTTYIGAGPDGPPAPDEVAQQEACPVCDGSGCWGCE